MPVRSRNLFETSNPFGTTPAEINSGLQSLIETSYVLTGAAAATDAPFVGLDRIDIFLLPNQEDTKLRELANRSPLSEGPKLRFIYPYDEGVFLYSRRDSVFPKASNMQAYLPITLQIASVWIYMREEAVT